MELLPRFGPSRRSYISGVLALGMSTMAGGACAADDLESGKFSREVLELLRLRRPQWQFELSKKPATIVSGNKELYLGNLFDIVHALRGRDRENRILDFVDAVVTAVKDTTAPQTYDAVRHLLRARVVPASYENQTFGNNVSMLIRPLSGATRVACAIDGDKAVEFVTTKHLKDWSMEPDAVLAAAVANLDDTSRGVEIKVLQASGGPGHFATVNVTDSYAAARLLAPRFMARLRAQLGPAVFAAVPNRDFLVAWSADFAKKREFAAQVAKDAATEAYALTNELFVSSAEGLRVATSAELREHGRS
jgi:uncharacterized protein YtpQ (UPF0354 family)